MQITININGEDKTFTASKVPMLARRKFMEIRAKEEELIEKEGNIPTAKQIEFENELINILVEIIFKNQFTVDELLNGIDDDYFDAKLSEAIFGIKDDEVDEGNEKGK